ncbi:hypothetical protein GCM10010377_70970 [Streptomyces viridiviolaceus]|nr:hypothetical protein GCM10010377_70970 [Streptomyces viridiviolaceus]
MQTAVSKYSPSLGRNDASETSPRIRYQGPSQPWTTDPAAMPCLIVRVSRAASRSRPESAMPDPRAQLGTFIRMQLGESGRTPTITETVGTLSRVAVREETEHARVQGEDTPATPTNASW